MQTWLLILGGLVLLLLGGELLVRGAVRLASRLGVSPLVIGLTLVGFGTSTPELVTSLQAALSGSPGIAYGNIVGSNIANLLLILGVSALVTPIAVTARALKRDSAVMLVVAVVFAGPATLTAMHAAIGAGFLAALAGYIGLTLRQERAATGEHGAGYERSQALQEADPGLAPSPSPNRSIVLSLLTAVGGLALVVFGGAFLVQGAVSLARTLGLSETVIGLTIVAVGTSLPELVTSLMAAIRQQADVAFGNIIGSNIYNILGIGGFTALIAPTRVPEALVGFDIPVMIAVSGLVVAFAATGRRIHRWEGALLLAGYIAYLAWIWP